MDLQTAVATRLELFSVHFSVDSEKEVLIGFGPRSLTKYGFHADHRVFGGKSSRHAKPNLAGLTNHRSPGTYVPLSPLGTSSQHPPQP